MSTAARLEYASERLGEPRVPRHLRGTKLGTLYGLVVYPVDGQMVRDKIYLDFTMGGNEAVFTFVPKNEIWIDSVLRTVDCNATIIHEYVERQRMMKHGESYNDAHDVANLVESRFRTDVWKIDSKLLRRKVSTRELERLIQKYKRDKLW